MLIFDATGFNYHFNSLASEEETEMIKAFNALFAPIGKVNALFKVFCFVH